MSVSLDQGQMNRVFGMANTAVTLATGAICLGAFYQCYSCNPLIFSINFVAGSIFNTIVEAASYPTINNYGLIGHAVYSLRTLFESSLLLDVVSRFYFHPPVADVGFLCGAFVVRAVGQVIHTIRHGL